MERKTRIWMGLGAAVLVGGTATSHAVMDGGLVAAETGNPSASKTAPGRVQLAQAEPDFFVEAGEGGPGEGGGQVLGTITEFRLTSTDPNAFQYDASPQVAAYGALVARDVRCSADAGAVAHAGRRSTRCSPTRPPHTLAAARAAWIAAPRRLHARPRRSCSTPVRSTAGRPGQAAQRLADRAGVPRLRRRQPRRRARQRPGDRAEPPGIVRHETRSPSRPRSPPAGTRSSSCCGARTGAAGPGAGRPPTSSPASGNNDRRRDYLAHRHPAARQRPRHAGRGLGAGRQQLPRLGRWRWTSATPSAGSSTAWPCSPATRSALRRIGRRLRRRRRLRAVAASATARPPTSSATSAASATSISAAPTASTGAGFDVLARLGRSGR